MAPCLNNKIAIIGIAGQFPKANDINEYWRNLLESRDCISRTPTQFLSRDGWIHAKGTLAEADLFSAETFRFTPKQAEITDPQFRLFLQWVYYAWNDAGYSPFHYLGKVGVYATSSTQDSYYENQIAKNKKYHTEEQRYEQLIHNARDFLATLVAYKFNFTGPCINFQTACSSSLVAASQACEDLVKDKCDVAVVGGVSITFPLFPGYFYQKGMIYSSDGFCRPFSEQANGVVPGNGGGVILLKRLSSAIADGDSIYAVIEGYAINNDGANKLSFTAPSVEGQVAVLTAAAKDAGVDPGKIRYIEAHGTGTVLGDQIEVAALKEYLSSGALKPKCMIGSVKSNIGHLDVASGIASLIKTALILKNKIIPKSLHSEKLNPDLGFNEALYVAQDKVVISKDHDDEKCFMGVSSFGVGGTNVHMILSDYTDLESTDERSKQKVILTLSAKTEIELHQFKNKIENYLSTSIHSVEDIEYTLLSRKDEGQHRLALVCRNRNQAISKLQRLNQNELLVGSSELSKSPVCFVFDLSDSAIENRVLSDDLMEISLFSEIYNSNLKIKLPKKEGCDYSRLVHDAIFQFSLAKFYQSLGLNPNDFLCCVLGEYLAMACTDIITLEEAIYLIVSHYEFFQIMSKKINYIKLLANKFDVNSILANEKINLVASYSFNQTVVAFEDDKMAAVKRKLESKNIFYCNISDKVVAIDSNEWRRQEWLKIIGSSPVIQKTSIFNIDLVNKAFKPELLDQKILNLVKQGAVVINFSGQTNILTYVQQAINHQSDQNKNVMLSANDSMTCLAHCWVVGKSIAFEKIVRAARRKCLSLPYPLLPRKRYFIDEEKALETEFDQKSESKLAEWIYKPIWIESVLKPSNYVNYDCIIVVGGKTDSEFFSKKYLEVKFSCADIIYVDTSAALAINKFDDQWYSKRVRLWSEIFSRLENKNKKKILIIHSGAFFLKSTLDEYYADGFYDFVAIAKAFRKHSKTGLYIAILADENRVETSLSVGPAMCLPLENEAISTKLILTDRNSVKQDIERITNEIQHFDSTRIVKISSDKRYRKSFEVVTEKITALKTIFKRKGTYLITGGLGGLGLTIAKFLAANYQAKLILIGVTPIPSREKWQDILHSSELSDREKVRIKQLTELENESTDLKIISADVTDYRSMKLVIAQCGHIDGVFHLASASPEGLAELKSFQAMRRMLETKITGFEILLECFSDANLDFLWLFSALSVFRGEMGSLDYISANAYLDFYAESECVKNHNFPIKVINWDAWSEVGMKYNYLTRTKNSYLGLDPILEGHKVAGNYVIPGAFLIDLFCAHHKDRFSDTVVFIDSLSFLKMGVITTSNYTIDFTDQCENNVFSSSLFLNQQGKKDLLMRVDFCYREDTNNALSPSLFDKIIHLINAPLLTNIDYQFDSPVELGPEWKCLQWVKKIDNAYLAKISLADEFTPRLSSFFLHPSMLDVALSFHARFLEAQYVPFRIEKMLINRSLPSEFYAYVKIESHDQGLGLCVSTITLFDKHRKIILTVEKFILKKINSQVLSKISQGNIISSSIGLSNDEGLEILKLVAGFEVNHIAVMKDKNIFTTSQSRSRQLRPMRTESMAKSSQPLLIDKIKKTWSDVLGVAEIKDDSDFFDLGGDSLFAIQVSYQLKKEYNIDVDPELLLVHSKLSFFSDHVSQVVSHERL